MDRNIYSRILGAVGDSETAETVTLRQGQVTGTQPLRVSVAGQVQPESALVINQVLLPRVERWQAAFTWRGETVTGTVTREEPGLQIGDHVLLLTRDDQKFYVLCKVGDAG